MWAVTWSRVWMWRSPRQSMRVAAEARCSAMSPPYPWSITLTPPKLHSFYLMSCGISLSECVQVESTARLLTNTLWQFSIVAVLHVCVRTVSSIDMEKSSNQSDSVHEQVPTVVQTIQRSWQDWIFKWQHLQAANFKRSSLLMLILGQCRVDQMASNVIWPK